MRFCSCFFLSTFCAFGFPIATPEQGTLDASQHLNEALSVSNDRDASNDFWTSSGENIFNQQLPDEVQPNYQSPSIPNIGSSLLAQGVADEKPGNNAENIFNQPLPDEAPKVPNTGSSLLAQNVGAGGSGGLEAAEAVVGAGVTAVELFLRRLSDINGALNNDHPNVKVTDIPFVGSKDGLNKKQGGARKMPAEAEAEAATATANGRIPSANWCPPGVYGIRTFPWCDLGIPESVELTPEYDPSITQYYIVVYGFLLLIISVATRMQTRVQGPAVDFAQLTKHIGAAEG
ncbi:hypothetical protein MMC22_002206 [Lobaria immixta]|nr:hypothetical protein [Lobaria immixta]